ncbi:malto-oligosyltrehalose trehalohydrolase [Achromobacter pestifer]
MSAWPEPFSFGALPLPDGRTRFRLWAPSAPPGLALLIDGQAPIPLSADAEGYVQADVACAPGTRYRYRLDEGLAVPDPASRLQDGDVHGASVVTGADAYPWRHPSWPGRPWEEAVIYEVHVGLAGGYAGLESRLPDLAALGITVIELMPIAQFPGPRNWGYDGVLPYAPDTAYGSPQELKRLIDTAHGLGMSVMLDVVYNHFGPDGNYLPSYAAPFFRHDIPTPWGAAIDFRQSAVRRFFQENALYWLTEYRFDGLRLDAVHAIPDHDWLVELATFVRGQIPAPRRIHLVLENDDNRASLLDAGYDAQWNDDAHHVLHHLLTGEASGYYADYAARPGDNLARCLAEGWLFQGQPSEYRHGLPRGEPSAHLAPTSFVLFLQNHDQIGNRMRGDRLTDLAATRERLRAAIALQVLAPQIPLIFMGEEHGSQTPFLYFTSHADPELAAAVREGRRKEFASFPEFGGSDPNIPDPNSEATYAASNPWLKARGADGGEWLAWYGTLLRLRHHAISPRLAGTRSLGACSLGTHGVHAQWLLGDGALLTLYANMGAATQPLPPTLKPSETHRAAMLFQSGDEAFSEACGGNLHRDSIIWLLEERS